jgi:hypothetical protein
VITLLKSRGPGYELRDTLRGGHAFIASSAVLFGNKYEEASRSSTGPVTCPPEIVRR